MRMRGVPAGVDADARCEGAGAAGRPTPHFLSVRRVDEKSRFLVILTNFLVIFKDGRKMDISRGALRRRACGSHIVNALNRLHSAWKVPASRLEHRNSASEGAAKQCSFFRSTLFAVLCGFACVSLTTLRGRRARRFAPSASPKKILPVSGAWSSILNIGGRRARRFAPSASPKKILGLKAPGMRF